MYQSVPSLTIPPGRPPGFAHSSCPWGRVFAPLSCAGVLNQSKSSIILKKNRFSLCVLNKWVASTFHMFTYARSEQCDSGPIYTIRNTQCIRIYPGTLKFILVKISQDPGSLHGKHAIENQTLFTFLTTENLSRLPCSHEYKYGAYSDLSSYAVNLPG